MGSPFTTPYGEDRHVLEVASVAEQEVLCGLLREYAAVLIGLTGRSPLGVGSRRLAGSREHVTTRYLRSAAAAYLSRLESSLRRFDGLAGLDHMDVFPGAEADGTLTVTVRCVDAAASVAATRAHAVLLAAFGLRAQRMVGDGNRLGEAPHRKVDDDRARAVARAAGAARRRHRRRCRAGPRPAAHAAGRDARGGVGQPRGDPGGAVPGHRGGRPAGRGARPAGPGGHHARGVGRP